VGHPGDHSSRIRENFMSTLTIQIPEGVARQLKECAEREGITIDQLLSSAAGEKLSALMTLDHLRERARNAKREDFVEFLNGSPALAPIPADE
jgi:hypothetical protein